MEFENIIMLRMQSRALTEQQEITNLLDTSIQWQIQDIRIVCDVVTLDSALQNSYAEHVLSGKTLPINYSTYISQFQTLTSI
jgi:hypothetical protein